jgi:hypothetical protein
VVHELNQFALRKPPKRIYVYNVMKEFVESVRKCPIQVVDWLEGHDPEDRVKIGVGVRVGGAHRMKILGDGYMWRLAQVNREAGGPVHALRPRVYHTGLTCRS